MESKNYKYNLTIFDEKDRLRIRDLANVKYNKDNKLDNFYKTSPFYATLNEFRIFVSAEKAELTIEEIEKVYKELILDSVRNYNDDDSRMFVNLINQDKFEDALNLCRQIHLKEKDNKFTSRKKTWNYLIVTLKKLIGIQKLEDIETTPDTNDVTQPPVNYNSYNKDISKDFSATYWQETFVKINETNYLGIDSNQFCESSFNDYLHENGFSGLTFNNNQLHGPVTDVINCYLKMASQISIYLYDSFYNKFNDLNTHDKYSEEQKEILNNTGLELKWIANYIEDIERELRPNKYNSSKNEIEYIVPDIKNANTLHEKFIGKFTSINSLFEQVNVFQTFEYSLLNQMADYVDSAFAINLQAINNAPNNSVHDYDYDNGKESGIDIPNSDDIDKLNNQHSFNTKILQKNILSSLTSGILAFGFIYYGNSLGVPLAISCSAAGFTYAVLNEISNKGNEFNLTPFAIRAVSVSTASYLALSYIAPKIIENGFKDLTSLIIINTAVYGATCLINNYHENKSLQI